MKFKEINTIEIIKESVDVYDIEVENSHMFLANGNYVHNCTTSTLTGIHASHVWLLEKINELKQIYGDKKLPKIVIDGGIDTIDKIIKSLALGADYIMLGKMFAECNDVHPKSLFNSEKLSTIFREYYGMASIYGQLDLTGKISKEPEGVYVNIPTKYSIAEFMIKFKAALQSCMSYCNCFNLKQFIGKVNYEIMSSEEFHSYYKEYKMD